MPPNQWFHHHLDLSCHAVNDRHVKDENSDSSHQAFYVNEPFYHNRGYKTNKVIKFFFKLNQFIKNFLY